MGAPSWGDVIVLACLTWPDEDWLGEPSPVAAICSANCVSTPGVLALDSSSLNVSSMWEPGASIDEDELTAPLGPVPCPGVCP